MIDARQTKKLKKEYECRCGARKCRGTMLAPPEKEKGDGQVREVGQEGQNVGEESEEEMTSGLPESIMW